MFHAHVSEFAELGWTGFFQVALRWRRGAATDCDTRPVERRAPAWLPRRWLPLALLIAAAIALLVALLGGARARRAHRRRRSRSWRSSAPSCARARSS